MLCQNLFIKAGMLFGLTVMTILVLIDCITHRSRTVQKEPDKTADVKPAE